MPNETVSIPNELIFSPDLTAEAKGLYCILATLADDRGNPFIVSNDELIELSSMSRERIKRHRSLLVDNGWLNIYRTRSESGGSGANAYELLGGVSHV